MISLVSATHALLSKRESRAALGWIAACIGMPIIGPLLYLLIGINRADLFDRSRVTAHDESFAPPSSHQNSHILDTISAKLSRYPSSDNNRVKVYRNGDKAYPAMLRLINHAEKYVFLSTYIFDSDHTGKRFVSALEECIGRGVQVRVMIDAVGSLYSFPSAVSLIRKAGIPCCRFLPLMHRHSWQLNMRNHRKILSIDGNVAFTGGMNIGNRHIVGRHRAGSAADVQFSFEGGVAKSLTHMFCRDWEFATGEKITVEDANSKRNSQSTGVLCRAISDGPDSEIGTLPKLLLGIIGASTKRITIITPYFLPPPAIIGSIIAAALRGVRVQILLPEKSNLPYVAWATEHMLPNILLATVEIYYQPKPFSHTKMLLVDDDFLQIGSYNMDSRSLRLNYELAVNVYDAKLRREIDAEVEDIITASKLVGMQFLANRSLPIRLRNAAAWLFTPYL